jgi:23S rRNA (adenine2503-C2)-methyltransferase
MGLRRNCTAAEIVDQFRAAAGALAARGHGPLTHVVFMGMGEPMSNLDSVIAAIKVFTQTAGLSARRITVSTSGIAPGIDKLTDAGIPVTLAVSLHAANDALRDRLVPINTKYPVAAVTRAARRYADKTGRRVTLEWCLIGGVNDSDEQAMGLHDIAHDLAAHVNVIPMNDIDGSEWGPPSRARTERFMSHLQGVRHTVRDTSGSETDAACGQLRANLEQRRWLLPDGTLSRPMARP